MKQAFKLKLAALAAILVLAGCSNPAPLTTSAPSTTSQISTAPTTIPQTSTPASSGPSGLLRLAVLSIGSEKFDPILADNTFVGNGLAPMMDHMFRTVNSKLSPGIIEKWDIAPDGLSWTFYVRKGVKLHGRERRVEGVLSSGDRVLMIDDLVTTGLTLKKACDAVRAEGGIVTEAVAFLDREEGGRQILEQNGIKMHTLLKISEIANTLFDVGAIDQENLKTILKQIKKKKT